jgi:hypothetical protein
MHFGLTNEPSTFQILMDFTFKPFLRKNVLAFFDDILSYIKYWQDNFKHVCMVLKLLEEKQLCANPSKCYFGVWEVEYFGHNISRGGVNVNPNKIKAMMECPIPKILKNITGLLGLTRHCDNFFKNYG